MNADATENKLRTGKSAVRSADVLGRNGWLWLALAILTLLHHDFWLWDERQLLFGFLPVGLAYHVGFSIAASAVWLAALNFAWPQELEAWAEGDRNEVPPPTV